MEDRKGGRDIISRKQEKMEMEHKFKDRENIQFIDMEYRKRVGGITRPANMKNLEQEGQSRGKERQNKE
jgi:hypothetical protein